MENKNSKQTFRKEVVQRVARNFLDILVLRLLQTQPMWGYKIIKKIEALFGVKVRHGAIYPLLSSLEVKNLVKCNKMAKGGRIRKIYNITPEGIQLVESYYDFLREQLLKLDLKED